MGLKLIIDKLEDVPENVRTIYKPENGKFILDVEGAVPKERLDEFRNNNIQLQQQLDKLKDVDPVKYRELTELQRKLQEKELIEKGEVEKVVDLRTQAMREDLTNKLTTSQTALEKAQNMLNTLLIDNVIKSAAIKNGVVPEAVDDVVLRAKAVYTVVDGVPTPKDAAGQVIFGKDGKTPMPVEEWLVGLKGSAKHLFIGNSGSGAGGGNGTGKLNPGASSIDKISAGLSNMGSLQSALPGAQ